MQHTRTDQGALTVLKITGTLDINNAIDLVPDIDQIVADRRMQVTVDLSMLEHIDDSGVATILNLYKRLHTIGGTVKVQGARDQPLAMLKELRINNLLTM